MEEKNLENFLTLREQLDLKSLYREVHYDVPSEVDIEIINTMNLKGLMNLIIRPISDSSISFSEGRYTHDMWYTDKTSAIDDIKLDFEFEILKMDMASIIDRETYIKIKTVVDSFKK